MMTDPTPSPADPGSTSDNSTAISFDYAPSGNPSDMPFVVSTYAGTTIDGQTYSHDDWELTVTLTPKLFVEGYFRFAQLPVDQHNGAVLYFYTQPPPDDPTGGWNRCTVTDV